MKRLGDLANAIAAGDLARVCKIADAAPALLREDYPLEGEGLLHWAASKGQLEVCQELARRGLELDAPSEVASLVAKGYVAPRRGGPLGAAIETGRVDLVAWFLQAGALVDGPSTATGTPLMAAAAGGFVEIVEALVDAGADLERESMTRPWTALDWAYPARGGAPTGGCAAVAALLEARGATRPFAAPHTWDDWRAAPQLRHIEQHLGLVHPTPHGRAAADEEIGIFRARFAPEKWASQLVFTAGLAPGHKAELAINLPAEWPTHRAVRDEPRFRWPFELLARVADAILDGAQVKHGDALALGDELLGDLTAPYASFIVARSDALEAKRRKAKGTAPTLVISPVLTRKAPPRAADAAKRAALAWEKRTLPVPDLTPTHLLVQTTRSRTGGAP